jgi:hypothetical protein
MMTPMPLDSDRPAFVVLRTGLALPLAAVELALDLEQRGFYLRREADDVLLVGPKSRLTEDDYLLIRRWKLHLLAIVTYADEHHGVH